VRRASLVSDYLGKVKGKYFLTAVSLATAASVVVGVPVIARAAAGAHDKTDVKRTSVRVMDNFFDPRSVEVAQGGKVTFVWKGRNRHNVRFTKVPAGASRKGSKTLRHGRWTRAFSRPGLYRYVCTLFSGMRGTITVKPAAVSHR
jgi:plastocyanin